MTWTKTLALVLLIPSYVTAQGYGPEVAASKMTVPEGFEVKLFASEPDIRQPVAMEFDHRGRLWVIQYLQYPNPAGLERVEVDRWSRTTYDRVPEPPPKGPRGADRITICEDTDGDGVADSFKDFVDGLNLASGLAFGHGGVFVLQVPYLLFYPDKNHDDIPDSDPEVCLTGFGMQDAHSVANSLT
ncbi:MAG: dehydrogenase, partial [Candidatus Omnitrophica bacterium]|nr:dehydrogenase [Candidatus Omnitrophota bacterium]